MQTIKIQTSQNIVVEYPLAGVGDRIVAYLVDVAIYFAYYMVLFFLHSVTNAIFGNPILAFILFCPVLFYSLLCETFMNGQTVGKKAKRIQVVSLDGNPASFGQYLTRWIFWLIDFTFTSGICAVVMTALTEKNQRLGDLVAGTTVIRTYRPVLLKDTIFEETGEAYHATYPDVTRLTEKDITLVREVLKRNAQYPNYELVVKTSDKIKNVLAIESDKEAVEFLKTVIRDYNFLTSQV